MDIRHLRPLLKPSVSFDQAYRELNDPRNRSTPQVCVEAIMVCVRERGIAALKDRENIDRLMRCDSDAREQIDERIGKLKKAGRIK